MNNVVKKEFTYDIVPEGVAVVARQAAERIRLRLKRSSEDIIQIGLDLLLIKKEIGHGNFLPWISSEFEMSDRTAHRFMRAAEVYGDKIDKVSNLEPSVLYQLASSNTTDDVREEVERLIESGEIIRRADIMVMEGKRGVVKKISTAASNQLDEYKSQIDELTSELEVMRAAKDKAVPLKELDQTQVFVASMKSIAVADCTPLAVFKALQRGGAENYANNMAMLEAAYNKIRLVKQMHTAA